MPELDRSQQLGLPYLLPAQAQKHVTHNEALQILDTVVQLQLLAFASTTPPGAALEGDAYGIGPAPTDAWAGQEGQVAVWRNGGWMFITPQAGWLAYAQSTQEIRQFRGGSWHALFQNLAQLGIATTADSTNRLAVSADASLLTHDIGGSHQLKINKAGPSQTASILLQSNWSGRAEIGLTGTNDIALKVSPDGSSFTTALSISNATAKPVLPQGAEINGPISGTAITQSASDTQAGRLLKTGDFGLGSSPLSANAGATFSSHGAVTGFIHMPNPADAAADRPLSSGRHWGLTLNSTPTHGLQLVLAEANRMFSRIKSDSSSYDDWLEWLSRAQILGATSQSAGQPTGALYERGSNANGDYTRFADGTQICWRYGVGVDVATTSTQAISGPASFSGQPIGYCASPTNDPANALRWPNIRMCRANTTGWGFRLVASGTSVDPNSDAEKMNFIAIGRWF